MENLFQIMKEIYREYENGKIIVGPTDMAKKLGLAKSTAQGILKKLASSGYGRYVEKKGFILNAHGLREARRAIRRHRLIECFMVYSLEMSPEKACIEAEKIDGFAGDYFIKRVEERYGKMRRCPCGKTIPR